MRQRWNVAVFLTVLVALPPHGRGDERDPLRDVPETPEALGRVLVELTERRDAAIARRAGLARTLPETERALEEARSRRSQLEPARARAERDLQFVAQIADWIRTVPEDQWALERPWGALQRTWTTYFDVRTAAERDDLGTLDRLVRSVDGEARATEVLETMAAYVSTVQPNIEAWQEADREALRLARTWRRTTRRIAGSAWLETRNEALLRATAATHLIQYGPRSLLRVRVTPGTPRLDDAVQPEAVFGGGVRPVYDATWRDVGERSDEIRALVRAVQEFAKYSPWVDALYDTRERALVEAGEELDALHLDYEEMILSQAILETEIEAADKLEAIIASGFNPATIGLEFADVTYDLARYGLIGEEKYALPKLADEFIAARQAAGESLHALEARFRYARGESERHRRTRAMVEGNWSDALSAGRESGPPLAVDAARDEERFETFVAGQRDAVPARLGKKLVKQLLAASLRGGNVDRTLAGMRKVQQEIGFFKSFFYYFALPDAPLWDELRDDEVTRLRDLVGSILNGAPGELKGRLRHNIDRSALFRDADDVRIRRFRDLYKSEAVRGIAADFVKDAVKDLISADLDARRIRVYYEAAQKQLEVFARRNELFAARMFREAHYDALGELARMLGENLDEPQRRHFQRDANPLAGEHLKAYGTYALWLEFDGPVRRARVTVVNANGRATVHETRQAPTDPLGRTHVIELGFEDLPWSNEEPWRESLNEERWELHVDLVGSTQSAIVPFDGDPSTPVYLGFPDARDPLGRSTEELLGARYVNVDRYVDEFHRLMLVWPQLAIIEDDRKTLPPSDGISRVRRGTPVSVGYRWAYTPPVATPPLDDRTNERWMVLRGSPDRGNILWAKPIGHLEGVIDLPLPADVTEGRDLVTELVLGYPGAVGERVSDDSHVVAELPIRLLGSDRSLPPLDETGVWMIRSQHGAQSWEGWVRLERDDEGTVIFRKGFMETPEGILPMNGFGMQWDGVHLTGSWSPYWTGAGDSRARVDLRRSGDGMFVGTRSVPEEWLNGKGWQEGSDESIRVELDERWIRPPIRATARVVRRVEDEWVDHEPSWDDIRGAWASSAGMPGNFPQLHVEVRGANLPVIQAHANHVEIDDPTFRIGTIRSPDDAVNRHDLWADNDVLVLSVKLYPGAGPGPKVLRIEGTEIPLPVVLSGY